MTMVVEYLATEMFELTVFHNSVLHNCIIYIGMADRWPYD